MPTSFNINRSTPTRDWKYFKLFLIPVNSIVAVINTLLLFSFPGLSTAIPQAGVYLRTFSAARIIDRSRINQLPSKTIHSNYRNMLFVALLSVSIMSCQSHAGAGIKKDSGTHLKAEQQDKEPRGSILVINDLLLRVIGISN
jgi:hypothetical protein